MGWRRGSTCSDRSSCSACSLRRPDSPGDDSGAGCSGWGSTTGWNAPAYFAFPGRLGQMATLVNPPVKGGSEATALLAGYRAAEGQGGFSSAAWPTPCSATRTGPRSACFSTTAATSSIPPGQGCCGAIHYYSGDSDGARTMADANVAAFDLDDLDAVIVNHAGCAMMKEYALHWPDDRQKAARRLVALVRDINEFLDELGPVCPTGRIEAVATYHDACHLGHAQYREAAAAAPGDHSGPQLRPAGDRDLLRIGGHVQSESARDGVAPRKAETRQYHGDRGRRSYWPPTRDACCRSAARSASTGAPLVAMHPMDLLDLSYRGEQPELANKQRSGG